MHTNIQTYHQALQSGQLTCFSHVTNILAQIEANKELNIFITIFATKALEKAKALDAKRLAGKPLAPLHGVIIGLKDVIAYENHTLTAASKILEGYVSPFSATVVQKLIDQDAIIIGSLNCDEFAMGSTNENSSYGPVKNPVNPLHVTGGSSGGSAAAVAAGLCHLALGSDTGGSVRQPADFCGVVGFKPTYGAVSRFGLIAYGSSFDVIGIFGNNIGDVELCFNIMAGKDAADSTTANYTYESLPKRKLKIGYYKEALELDGLDIEIKKGITQHLDGLKTSGYEIIELPFPLLKYVVPAYYVLTTAEATSNLSRYDGVRYGFAATNATTLANQYESTRSQGFGLEVQRRIMMGNFVLSAGYYDAYFTKAQKLRQLLYNKTMEAFEQVDIIAMPVSPTTAPLLNSQIKDPIAMYTADIYTVYANLVGMPALATPLSTHSNGLPFGMQFMAKPYAENELFTLVK
jgi:aspartyl-tRNA(Asn)/glutamyl-tRNA(Gln) amidotransferase subunit A